MDVEGFARRVLHQGDGQAGKVVDGVLGHLTAVGVQHLGEVAVFEQQTYAHQGQGQIGGGLEVVAGKYAQTTGIDGDGFVEAEFRGKIDNGALLA